MIQFLLPYYITSLFLHNFRYQYVNELFIKYLFQESSLCHLYGELQLPSLISFFLFSRLGLQRYKLQFLSTKFFVTFFLFFFATAFDRATLIYHVYYVLPESGRKGKTTNPIPASFFQIYFKIFSGCFNLSIVSEYCLVKAQMSSIIVEHPEYLKNRCAPLFFSPFWAFF